MLLEHHLAVSLQEPAGGRMIRAAFIEVVEVYVVLGLAQSRLLFCGYSFLMTGPKAHPARTQVDCAMSGYNSSQF